MPVKVETVNAAPLKLYLPLTGTVEAGRIAQLASPVEGPVSCCVRVREGEIVAKGQVMLTLGHTARRVTTAGTVVAQTAFHLVKENAQHGALQSVVFQN